MKKFSQSNKDLLPHEKWDYRSVYMPQHRRVFLDSSHIAESYLRPPGRFRSPIVGLERLRLRISGALRIADHFRLSSHFDFVTPPHFIPFPWRVLLKYLHREGILRLAKGGVATSPLRNDFPKSFFYDLSFEVERRQAAGGQKKQTVTGWGNSLVMEDALSKSIGEVLERYFLAGSQIGQVSSWGELDSAGLKLISPKALSCFDELQKERFPRLRFDRKSRFNWVIGHEVSSSESIFIPTQCVLRGYDFGESEPILREPNSNGCAGHFTLEEAILAGIYENVERDGFLIFWLNAIAPPVIDPTSVKDPEFQKLLERFSRYQFEARFLNTTTDIGIPSFLCVLIDRSGRGPRIAVGGGCGWDVESALKGALCEASSVHNAFSSQEPKQVPNSGYQPFSDKSFRRTARILLWQNPEMYPKIEPFLSGPKQTLQEAFPNLPHFKDVAEEYTYVRNIFQKLGKGYEIYYYEAKHQVLERIGYHVVKVIIPEIVHLYLNEALPPLAASRLKAVPTKLGYKAAKEWNPWPHPFP